MLRGRSFEAQAQGFTVIESTERTLLLDLDNGAAWLQFERVLPLVRTLIGVSKVQTWKSKSGVGRHVLVTLRHPESVWVRVALQAALGSDGKREVLTLKRLENGVHEPSMLFRPKDAKLAAMVRRRHGLGFFHPRDKN